MTYQVEIDSTRSHGKWDASLRVLVFIAAVAGFGAYLLSKEAGVVLPGIVEWAVYILFSVAVWYVFMRK